MGLNELRWITMLSKSIANQPRYTVCTPLCVCQSAHECFCLCAVITTKQDIYSCIQDDVRIETEGEKEEQMVSCLSVSINLITGDHI